jgi:hypothetical protein
MAHQPRGGHSRYTAHQPGEVIPCTWLINLGEVIPGTGLINLKEVIPDKGLIDLGEVIPRTWLINLGGRSFQVKESSNWGRPWLFQFQVQENRRILRLLDVLASLKQTLKLFIFKCLRFRPVPLPAA